MMSLLPSLSTLSETPGAIHSTPSLGGAAQIPMRDGGEASGRPTLLTANQNRRLLKVIELIGMPMHISIFPTAAGVVASLLTHYMPLRSRRSASRAADGRRNTARRRDAIEFGERARDTRLEHQVRADTTPPTGEDHRQIA